MKWYETKRYSHGGYTEWWTQRNAVGDYGSIQLSERTGLFVARVSGRIIGFYETLPEAQRAAETRL